MTLPDERYQAIRNTEQFLRDLVVMPGLSPQVKQRAQGLLRHYPGTYHLDQLAERSPDVIAVRIEPLTRMVMQYEETKQ